MSLYLEVFDENFGWKDHDEILEKDLLASLSIFLLQEYGISLFLIYNNCTIY